MTIARWSRQRELNARVEPGLPSHRGAGAVPTPSLVASVFLAASCAPGGDLPPLPAAPDTAYRLGAGDQVRIITFGEQQLTGQFRVSDNGAIELPLVGSVDAAGQTTRQLAERITSALRNKKLFRDPSVSVEIAEYRPIFILGEVSKPGQFPYQPGMTVLTAVAVAGGFTYRAVQDRMSVVRTTGGQPVEAIAGGASLLQPGDVITVYERHF